MFRKEQGALLLLAALCLPAIVRAAEEPAADNKGMWSNDLTTEQELLLFWEKRDLYVETAGRVPKPVFKTAENVTVITAKEIEAMNAHTVAEILSRVPGVFLNGYSQDFGASSLITIQGSEPRHVLVLLDGIALNLLSGGSAETNTIPVQIIDRVEIVQGPASAAWGSSLGGVISITTKPAGYTRFASGAVSTSMGAGQSQDHRFEVGGKADSLGYYVYAGRLDSDGLDASDRYFTSNYLYSKASAYMTSDVNAEVSVGYSEPDYKVAEAPDYNITQGAVARTFWANASLDATLTRALELKLALYALRQRLDSLATYLDDGPLRIQAGDLYQDVLFDEATVGGSARLIRTGGGHDAVAGLDLSNGALDQTVTNGEALQHWPAKLDEGLATHPAIAKWAVYANDTITLGKLAVTPGLRYDHNDLTGGFLSPSLGLAWKTSETTVLRASVAQGFSLPGLTLLSGGGFFTDPNPDLRPEKVWSLQAGLETGLGKWAWVKVMAFRHDISDSLTQANHGDGTWWINGGGTRRQGVELDAESATFYNLALVAGVVYTHKDLSAEAEAASTYAEKGPYDDYNAVLGLRYDDKKGLRGWLFGHYALLAADVTSDPATLSEPTWVWDLTVRKRLARYDWGTPEVFFTGHNLFSGRQDTNFAAPNPDRWLEAGIRFGF